MKITVVVHTEAVVEYVMCVCESVSGSLWESPQLVSTEHEAYPLDEVATGELQSTCLPAQSWSYRCVHCFCLFHR